MTLPERPTMLLPSPAERGGVHEVFHLALPVVLSNLSLTMLHVVDAAFVGRLGATPLAAVGYGGIWTWTAMCGFVGVASGVQTFVAQSHGAGRPDQCARWAWHALHSVVPAAGFVILLYALGFPWLVSVMGPSAELQTTATIYVQARAWGAMASVAIAVQASFFRGVSDTRTPLRAMVFANVVNAFLDWTLVFGKFGLPALGVQGAGIASSIAEWGQALLLFWWFRRGPVTRTFDTRRVATHAVELRRYLRTALPMGGQWLLEMITFALFSTLVARMGDTSMAASQVLITLLHLSFMQALGISVAAQTLVGRYMGASDLASAVRSHQTALRLGIGVAVAVGALFMAVPERLIGIFTDDPAVIAFGRPLLALGAGFQFLDAVGIIANGSLRGAGDTRWPFWVQTGLAWFLFLPAAYLFGVVLGGELTGAWIGGCVYLAVLSSVFVLRVRSEAWQQIRI